MSNLSNGWTFPKLFKKTKTKFYSNLNVYKITDNKPFWKIVKPSFIGKIWKVKKIIPVENDNAVSEEVEAVKTFPFYFDGTVEGFNISSKCY